MARAIWKGSISFGLVNIPIALYAATRREELKFRLLRKSDLSPVNYKRVAEKEGIAKVVIKTRQYLAGIKPEDGALDHKLMHFAEELADHGKLHDQIKT